MKLSQRVQSISESLTLSLNSKVISLSDQGKKIYNLTAGQLPFRPVNDFTNLLRSELDFLKSYQYSPVDGFADLKKKVLNFIAESRGISFDELDFDVIVSNGAKHSLSQSFQCLIDPGDEVIFFVPYWTSYPEMVRFCDGVPVIIPSTRFSLFTPRIEDIKKSITSKTKAVVINSPNNPSGLYYSEKWMNDFGLLMKDHPDITIISDEIYYELNYYDHRPKYFYQMHPELLERTIIIDGISKTFACTGLRIGYCISNKKLISAMKKVQGQMSSGANSLTQRALVNFNFKKIEDYLVPIKRHIRENAEFLKITFKEYSFDEFYYQSNSAFYYIVDFSGTSIIKKYSDSDQKDYSVEICEDILENCSVALVPGKAFGIKNMARMSLVIEKDDFQEACRKLFSYIFN